MSLDAWTEEAFQYLMNVRFGSADKFFEIVRGLINRLGDESSVKGRLLSELQKTRALHRGSMSLPEPTVCSDANTPFNRPLIRDWFFHNKSVSPRCPRRVSVVGNGPFEKADFAAFVLQYGISVDEIASTTTVLVIGRADWTKRQINNLIDDRSGHEGTLRIYSQEMFLAHMLGTDPFLSGPAVLEEFKVGHPALELLASGWSGWVQPWIRGSGSGIQFDRVEQSPLRVLGYHVGESGLPTPQRRVILKLAFEENLPFVYSEDYMDSWGEPSSSSRLRKIAELLAANCRSGIARRLDFAVTDWLDDLSWLKEAYYHGQHQFQWPGERLE